ncbi:hypothetical protein C9426_35810 [Serratia sp. S1B]|nr:hypothetical protein C9426_35810 [Serratia sp. S1B]
MTDVTTKLLSSKTEPSALNGTILPGSETELIEETRDYDRVRKANCYVRSFTQGVKDTYVESSGKNEHRLRWPAVLIENLTTSDRDNLEPQLRALPASLGQQVLDDVAERVGTGEIKSVIAYLLTTLKRARNGQFNMTASVTTRMQQPPSPPRAKGAVSTRHVVQQEHRRASAEQVAQVMAKIRAIYRQ